MKQKRPETHYNVEVPGSAIVPCPLQQGFAEVYVQSGCVGCAYFKGFMQIAPDAKRFCERYRVVCSKPILRSIREVIG